MLEVLGASLADRIQSYCKSLKLSSLEESKMDYLIFIKTHQYDQMMKRYFEPMEEPVSISNMA